MNLGKTNFEPTVEYHGAYINGREGKKSLINTRIKDPKVNSMRREIYILLRDHISVYQIEENRFSMERGLRIHACTKILNFV